MTMDEKDTFLLLSHLDNFYLSKLLIKKACLSFNGISKAFSLDESELKSKLSNGEIESLKKIKSELQKLDLNNIQNSLRKQDINYLAFCEENYPKKLKDITDPPSGLFYKGNLDLLNKKSVAIVGTRNATTYGLNTTKKIAAMLAERDIVVVSGMASGIDTSSHIGALKEGKTIAVLGTGADVIYPISNKDLYYEILEKGGLILSEYPPLTEGMPWNFPQRNRIISALSDAVVVIEGDLQSGALITARFAIKQNKPLFALPGPIDSPQSNGPNILIKSGVGELLTSVNDILEKFGEEKQIKIGFDTNSTNGLTNTQKNIYNLLSSQSKGFDRLLGETNLGMQELIQHLSILELKGIVEKTMDGGYIKV